MLVFSLAIVVQKQLKLLLLHHNPAQEKYDNQGEHILEGIFRGSDSAFRLSEFSALMADAHSLRGTMQFSWQILFQTCCLPNKSLLYTFQFSKEKRRLRRQMERLLWQTFFLAVFIASRADALRKLIIIAEPELWICGVFSCRDEPRVRHLLVHFDSRIIKLEFAQE